MVNDKESYWYDVATGSVVRGPERKDGWLGPFGTAEEAEEAPATFIAHAQAWLSSEEGQRYLAMAEEGGEELNLDLDNGTGA
ncbi:hypothetical protein L615_008000000200 [Nocardioides sp. J9]|uniref:hypothetical protein n=1 Tax=unclassified Nocardioides TaxID=2615069 RepID=UPI0004916FA2|nr:MULTISPECIES: hypothetical protein [unclassified Nocardioides]TWG91422.1 hypothetical protein L615_008000000200 [Nocardioides sp. J9]